MEETLTDGCCDLPGEVYSSAGLLLCERHAGEVEASEHVVLLRGIVSVLDLCLASISVHRDEDLLRALRSWRANAAEDLARALQDPRLRGT